MFPNNFCTKGSSIWVKKYRANTTNPIDISNHFNEEKCGTYILKMWYIYIITQETNRRHNNKSIYTRD